MYQRMLNYFENDCCIENIFMKKFWYIWDIVLIVTFTIWIIFSILNINIIILIVVVSTIWTIFSIFYFRIYKQELQKELQYEKLKINWLAIFNKQRFLPAYFEFQEKKLGEYFKIHNFTNDDKEKFLMYVNEDLENKYPPNKIKENFLNVIVPTTIAVVSIYLTNAGTNDLNIIISTIISAIIYAGMVTVSIYGLSRIGKMVVNQRRNLLDLKDVLRSITI